MSFQPETTHVYTYVPTEYDPKTGDEHEGQPIQVEYTAHWEREQYGADGDGRRGEMRTVLVDIEVDPAFEFLRADLSIHACQ